MTRMEKVMTKKTTVSFIIETDDQGKRTITNQVIVSKPDEFETEEAKEQSVSEDIQYLFDNFDSGEISAGAFI